MPDRLKVEEIADRAGLEALRADWLDLWQRVPTATPFQSPAWLVPWWRVFDDGKLITLALRAGDQLVGVAARDHRRSGSRTEGRSGSQSLRLERRSGSHCLRLGSQ